MKKNATAKSPRGLSASSPAQLREAHRLHKLGNIGTADIAERTAAVGKFIEGAGSDAKVWPTTRDIILGGRKYSAVDAFEGQYRLKSLKERAAIEMRDLDFLALPTAGSIYTKADLEREPVLYNSNLGHYTNFVNFFGLSGLALPFGFRPDGMPFGITLISHAFGETTLLRFGARWQEAKALPLGKPKSALPLFKQYREADGLFYFKLQVGDAVTLLGAEGGVSIDAQQIARTAAAGT